ncbi:MAG TPA: type II toxin-antitoxin system VapC family toxin [Candidatus Korarchaeota archaeon]|nr:type II toxin-antitoxin system VapC family toxin [Candidatus Korarchaeota archaeon]
MRYLCDTSFLVDLISGDEGAVKKANELDKIASLMAVSVITVHEYLRGVYYLYWNKEQLRDKLREAKEDLRRFEVIPFDEEIAEIAAEIDARLVRSGTPIGYPDVVIAATALSKNLILITRNIKHFSLIEGIRIETY